VFNTEAHPVDVASLYCCSSEKSRDDLTVSSMINSIELLATLHHQDTTTSGYYYYTQLYHYYTTLRYHYYYTGDICVGCYSHRAVV